ncbi:hypothetical protein GCM10023333_19570 [Ferrimonas pelagia]|uniref:Uncharacterized protein n=1 Tax=Ferrimonas pelagia TaxID=1177826 RepID=A0ABP9EUL6_9GAMM
MLMALTQSLMLHRTNAEDLDLGICWNKAGAKRFNEPDSARRAPLRAPRR